jgi:formiminotetrahydrofolate cyclodeaminase
MVKHYIFPFYIDEKSSMIIIFIIVFVVAVICISLLILVSKLVKDTNKEIVTKLGTKVDIKGVKLETGLEINISENNKEKQ